MVAPWLLECPGTAGGRRRRSYELTPAGRRRLAGDRVAWRDFASAVSAILEPAP
jgi:PadR family transcriptional regulator, regulatory protein PadR